MNKRLLSSSMFFRTSISTFEDWDMGVSKNKGTANGWFIMENPITMDDLGGKPTILGNIHMVQGHLATWWNYSHQFGALQELSFLGGASSPLPNSHIRGPSHDVDFFCFSSKLFFVEWQSLVKWVRLKYPKKVQMKYGKPRLNNAVTSWNYAEWWFVIWDNHHKWCLFFTSIYLHPDHKKTKTNAHPYKKSCPRFFRSWPFKGCFDLWPEIRGENVTSIWGIKGSRMEEAGHFPFLHSFCPLESSGLLGIRMPHLLETLQVKRWPQSVFRQGSRRAKKKGIKTSPIYGGFLKWWYPQIIPWDSLDLICCNPWKAPWKDMGVS